MRTKYTFFRLKIGSVGRSSLPPPLYVVSVCVVFCFCCLALISVLVGDSSQHHRLFSPRVWLAFGLRALTPTNIANQITAVT